MDWIEEEEEEEEERNFLLWFFLWRLRGVVWDHGKVELKKWSSKEMICKWLQGEITFNSPTKYPNYQRTYMLEWHGYFLVLTLQTLELKYSPDNTLLGTNNNVMINLYLFHGDIHCNSFWKKVGTSILLSLRNKKIWSSSTRWRNKLQGKRLVTL